MDPPRTLVGRLTKLHLTVTIVALVATATATVAAFRIIAARQVDENLFGVALRVASAIDRMPVETREPRWLAYEIDEQRPSGTRVEVRSTAGDLVAGLGEGFALPKGAVGCSDYGPVRACGARSGSFLATVGAIRATERSEQRSLLVALSFVTVIAAALVAVLGRRVTRRALAPLVSLTSHVTAVEPGEGQPRAPRSGLAELDGLASRFDELLGRFEEALARERRLAAQASHELRTPLALARAEIETLAASTGAAGASRALGAVDQLSELVEALLWFAKAQERLDDEQMEIVNVADVVRAHVADDSRRDPPVAMACVHPDLPDEALVRGDERLLDRVVANLLENALKYGGWSPPQIRARARDGRLELVVSNAGVLSADVGDRVFEPFFRTGAAADAPGFGLGLPFARAVARAHGGDLCLDPTEDGRVAFVLTLPLLDWHDKTALEK
jgi:signal transduction histidine kinase